MKQVIVVRQDLRLPAGKLAAQVAHAAVSCYDKTSAATKKKWLAEGMKKVVLKVKDEKELLKYADSARMAGLATSIITDAGRTVVEPGTITCAGIGPDDDDSIDAVTGSLKML
jgi:peptidyl-tRNA hydrolase, PTH2 family